MAERSTPQAVAERSPAPLLERESEVRELRALLDSAARGEGRAVLVEGPAGIGKSRLLEALAEDAAERGFQVLRASGGELERELGWGAVRELLEPCLRHREPEEREALLSGAAALARPILWPTEEPPPAVEGEALLGSALHGLYWLCADLAERSTLALLIDDAHWADAASLRFLAYLAQRLGDLPVLLALGVRTGEAGEDGGPLASIATRGRIVRPHPLSEGAVTELLGVMLHRSAAPEFASLCHEATAGNPFLIRELAHELIRDDVPPSAENASRVAGLRPEAVRRSVLLRLSRLPDPARRLADAGAILGREVPLSQAASLAGLDAEVATSVADALAAVQILAPGVPLSFAHPITRSVMLEEIPRARRATLHRRAAELLNEEGVGEQAAGHLLATDPRGDERVVEILRREATESVRRRAPDAAVAFLSRALREPPGADNAPLVLAELAEAEATAGSLNAIEHLEQALELTQAPRERAALSLRLGWFLCRMGRIVEGSEVLERALADSTPADGDIALELEAAFLANAWQDSSRAAAVRRRQIEFLERNRDAPGSAQRALIAQSALGRLFAGEPVGEVVSLAQRLFADRGVLTEEGPDSLTPWIAIGCLSWSDALDAAEEAIEQAMAEARRRRSPVAVAHGFYARAWPRFWRGLVGEAAADAEAAIAGWQGAWEMYLPAARYWLAVSLLELDQLEGAEAALSLPGDDRWTGTTPHLLWRAGRATVAIARGDLDDALEELSGLGDQLTNQFLIHNPALLPWRSLAATAAARIGETERAKELARSELELARRFGAPRPIGIALRAAGLVEGGERGLELLADSVGTLQRSPARLERCRSLVELGAALRRAKRRREAREALRSALELAHRLGARALERRAREELEASGARLGRVELSGPESLTPSERRIAELAAAGNTNREIAQQLFLSLRTVETHLTHAYRKLDISSRGELAGALGD